jgi:outer membrane translocation and assembly module TamA
MHILTQSLLFSLLANAGLGQQPVSTPSANNIRINKLVIESNTLPDADREQIIDSFQQKTYFQPEIGARIEIALRNLGYFKTVVHEPSVSVIAENNGTKVADLIVNVDPGSQYRLREIHFRNATVFPSPQLRELFALQDGDLFNVTKFSEGLDNLRKLYGTQGYVNCVANPVATIDESHHVIDLDLSLDEGKPFNFGQLYLEGVEPHAGAGKALLDSWKSLEGKRYNPDDLHQWLLANGSSWHVNPQNPYAIKIAQKPDAHVVNVTLTQWSR